MKAGRSAERTIILSACLAIAASGCAGLGRTRVPAPAGPVFPLAGVQALYYEGRVIPPAVTGDGLVVFVTDRGYVYALDAGRMTVDWVYRAGRRVSRPPGLGKGRVYVFDDNNGLHCLDRSGRLLWERVLSESASGPLNEAGGVLCVGTEQGNLIALDPSDGRENWRFQAGAAVRTGALGWTDSRGSSFILCGGDEGRLYFLSKDGRRRGYIACGGKLLFPPLLEGDRLYLGTDDQRFLCLDLAKRKMRWRARLTGQPATTPLADARRVFFLTAQGVVMCLDKKGGSILWWRTISSRSAFSPVLAGDQVVVGALAERLFSFRTRDGREAGSYAGGHEIRSNPLWVPPHLLVHVSDRGRDGGALLFLSKEKDGGKN